MKISWMESLRSEIATVEGFLAKMPEDAFIERLSWEGRLSTLKEQLAPEEAQPQPIPSPDPSRGGPLLGAPSIDGVFAAEALQALQALLDLLDKAAGKDEDAHSDIIAEVHPRAAAKVHAFAKVLLDHEALFVAAFENRQIRFENEDQVRRVLHARAAEDISEEQVTEVGTLLGVLPHSRVFEANLADGSVVKGKVDAGVADILGLKAEWEGHRGNLRFTVVKVRTNRRYLLLGIDAVAPSSEEVGR